MTTQQIDQAELAEVARKYVVASDALLRGQPGPMIEAFLPIEDKDTSQLVPFTLNENQEYVHQVVFEPLTSWLDVYEEVWLKDRQATFTSLMEGVGFVGVMNIPGTHVCHVFQDKDTGVQLRKRLGLFAQTWPKVLMDHDGHQVVVDTDTKRDFEVLHYQDGVLKGRSSYLIISAGEREFGAGPNFTHIFWDEYDLYDNLDLYSRINAAKGKNCRSFKMSTPRGQRQLHTDYFAAKNGTSSEHAGAVFCFQNSRNSLPRGRGETAFAEDFDLLPEHLRIVKSPQWEERTAFHTHEEVLGFFRWWEWKRSEIRRKLQAKGVFDERRVQNELEAWHCSDDIRPWSLGTVSPFDSVQLTYHAEQANERTPRFKEIAPGAMLRIWVPPRAGMVCASGMDCAEDVPLGDAVAAYIKNAAGVYCADLVTSGQAGLIKVARAFIHELWLYGEGRFEPLFAPEVDGGLGFAVINVAKDMGYQNLWTIPKKPGVSSDRYRQMPDKQGWRTQGNKEDMKQTGIANFNAGNNEIFSLELLRDMANFDPRSPKHTSDLLMGYFITEMITDGPGYFAEQFKAMVAQSGAASVGRARLEPQYIPTRGGY